MTEKKWQFWVDRGGTFTDLVARHPDGSLSTKKLLSENPGLYEDAAIEAIRQVLDLAADAPLPADKIAAIKMGTTVATNALLERKGEPTLFVTNKGLRDVLLIGDQQRPDLFALKVRRIQPLYDQVVEVEGRMDAQGQELSPLNLDDAHTQLKVAFDAGLRSVAIALMHGYRYPTHEEALAKLAADVGFRQVSTSHGAVAMMKLVPRGETAVADAYLSPILKKYRNQVASQTTGIPLYFMQSNGGLTAAEAFEGKDAILSGPAGGIVGAAKTAAIEGFEYIIGFDMGGTSTDVAHYAGAYERTWDTVISGTRIKVPMMDIHTVAAGGGSICTFDGERYRVGPESAGAHPGPACYGKGGPLTVTDCNLLTGRIQAAWFPKAFGEAGDQPLSLKAAEERAAVLVDAVEAATGKRPELSELAAGFLNIAIEHMARAIRKISIERGHDLAKYCIQSFGGAGGQHAALVADALGIEQVMMHPFAGILSALGMGLADLGQMREQTLEAELNEAGLTEAGVVLETLAADACETLAAQNIARAAMSVVKNLHLKYQGSDTSLSIPFDHLDVVEAAFSAAHKEQFGFDEPDKTVIIDAVVVEATGGGDDAAINLRATGENDQPIDQAEVYTSIGWQTVAVYHRDQLRPDVAVMGPALMMEQHGTNYIPTGWEALISQHGNLLMQRVERRQRQHDSQTVDPVLLEIFNNRFMGLAEEMGAVLEKTAHSVNMKERLDFSCAIFDPDGQLVANAPHMPVHLGSMGDSVKTVVDRNRGLMRPGDVYMLNDPYNGGTHLPDVTVISPVFLDADDSHPAFYVASRGHHADIGGLTPGSMPPNSRTIEEEGVLLDNVALVKAGRFLEAEVRALLTEAKYPARNPDQNIADLKAQVASNERGIKQMLAMVQEFGAGTVLRYMRFIQENAEAAVRRVLGQIDGGQIDYELDHGAKIVVSISVDKQAQQATIDFTGTSAQLDSNYNAPRAVTLAAILYVFRTLVDDEIPLNAGCLKPVNIIVPEGCFLNPTPPAAVVAGNVETSQAVTNALYLAMGKLAAGQGTMNNLTFGNARVQYYETIAGGAGAGEGFDGEDALQLHMTNSRLTDPEVLEWRYPVILEQFRLRPDSGGRGRWHGGNGLIREIRFLEEMELSILSSHRRIAPAGLKGAGSGAKGINRIIRASGQEETLDYAAGTIVKAGDRFHIATPGGGGYDVHRNIVK